MDAVHVWRIDVRQPLDGLVELLSEDEAERAAQFRFERDRASFVATRGALRTLAGAYLGRAPADVRFSYGPKGKPELEGVAFNVSHAGDVALAAFAASGRIGVDVEEKRGDADLTALARRFFAVPENAALDRLAADSFIAGFYSCWTRKEAFVKAVGEGLSFDLDRVEVSVHPEPARIVSVDGDGGASRRWVARDVEVPPGYAAAVVFEGAGPAVVVREWGGPATVAA